MKQGNDFLVDLLDFDRPEAREDVLWRAYRPTAAEVVDGDVIITVPFQAQTGGLRPVADDSRAQKKHFLRVRAYDDVDGPVALRLSITFAGEAESRLIGEDGPMLALDPSLIVQPLSLRSTGSRWEVLDPSGVLRLSVTMADPPVRPWAAPRSPSHKKHSRSRSFPTARTVSDRAA